MLLLDGRATTRDIAEVLGSSEGAVQTVRQSIRRKLAIPRNADLAAFVHQVPGLYELVHEAAPPVDPLPAADRRTNLVLRAALRELETAATHVRAKAAALAALAGDETAEAHEAILAEVAVIEHVAEELEALRDRSIEFARNAVS